VALAGSAVERHHVLGGRVLVERARVRVADVLEPFRDRLEHELVVAVRLLGLVPLSGVVLLLGEFGRTQELGLVLGEEVELPADEVAEAAAAPEDQSSSR
jgi:hypothetical protein